MERSSEKNRRLLVSSDQRKEYFQETAIELSTVTVIQNGFLNITVDYGFVMNVDGKDWKSKKFGKTWEEQD